ncbi:hypothetical protein LOC67_20190 [Stieleria sp. JC731]|uniref:hypothetical protein n=1 Tax=Pirellulaceae TaxID=2691357 RepID=UPI001E36A26E|nr:hypothetical protein [Stieleria sp. JC731]MCC9602876.1 hypothetical protein [Stieleria sp. JC731]
MLSKIAKLLLVASSLAPVLAAFAVREIASGKPVDSTWPLLLVTVALPVICFLVIHYAKNNLERQSLHVKKIKSTDKEVLAYLIAYLLPLLATDVVDFRDNTLTTVFIFGMIFLAIYHSNAFHFNPLLGFVGFHFYEVVCDDDMTYLLVTNRIIRKQSGESTVVQLSDYIFFELGHE